MPEFFGGVGGSAPDWGSGQRPDRTGDLEKKQLQRVFVLVIVHAAILPLFFWVGSGHGKGSAFLPRAAFFVNKKPFVFPYLLCLSIKGCFQRIINGKGLFAQKAKNKFQTRGLNLYRLRMLFRRNVKKSAPEMKTTQDFFQ